MLAAFVTGLVTGLGLIVAIGAQNAYVIRMGVMGRHVFAVTTICFLCDAFLIALGVAGLGTLIATTDWLRMAAAWGGAAFVTWFGARSLWNGVRRDHRGIDIAEGEAAADPRAGAKAAIWATLAFSLLNPHVYLDTVVMLGTIGAQFPLDGRLAFTVGAVIASGVWFYGIGYGARAASPLFHKPAATRALDLLVAAVMFAVAIMLIRGELAR